MLETQVHMSQMVVVISVQTLQTQVETQAQSRQRMANGPQLEHVRDHSRSH